MKPLFKLLLLTSTVPVQTHILSLLPFSFSVDLILIVTYCFGYFKGKTRGMMVGAYLGIVMDLLSGELLGTQMFLKTLVGYFAALFGLGVFSKDLPVHFLLLIFFSLANGAMNLFIINLFGGDLPFAESFVVMILPAVGWNAAVGSVVLFFLHKKSLITEFE